MASKDEKFRRPWMEWTASSVGAVIVVAALVHFGWQVFSRQEQVPQVSIAVESVQDHRSGYTVALRASNRAKRTASDVVIEGELSREGTRIATSRFTLDYLPGKGTRRGGLYFARDPRQFDLTVRALGYALP